MVARLYRKNIIIKCDCAGCRDRATWVQAFDTKYGVINVDLCPGHHIVLRTKVPDGTRLNEDVLKWLLVQDKNPHNVANYGILRGPIDIKLRNALKNIKLEFE